jgi:hypothetical protein
MLMFLFTSSSPLVSPMVPVTANVIVSPSFASASACRNEPGPLSFVFVTGMMLECARTIAHKSATQITGNLVQLDVILVFTKFYRYQAF